MRHLYDDNKWTNFCLGCSRHVKKPSLDKVTEFVKLFNAITLMHYMTKKRKQCTYCVTKDALYSTLVKIELHKKNNFCRKRCQIYDLIFRQIY